MKASTLVGTALLIALSSSLAQAQLFKDKTITLMINYGAGGNADTEGRVFERHLRKYIEGNPNIIVQNIPGAGGLTAINQMGMGIGVRSPDLTMGFFTFNPIAVLVDDPALRVKVENFPVIAAVGAHYVAYGRKDAVPAPGRPQDIVNSAQINAAGYARNSNHDIRLRFMFELLGTRHKIVTGFQSIGAVNVAIEQNEINFMLSTTPGYETQAVPNLIERGIAIPFWQMGATLAGKNGLTGSEKIKAQGIKFFEEVYQDAKGKWPSGIKYDALRVTNDLSATLARVVMMPPGASKEAVEEIRRAFKQLEKDSDFITEYQRVIKSEPIIYHGQESQHILAEALKKTTPEIKKSLKEAAGIE
jgi:hypothetical protein